MNRLTPEREKEIRDDLSGPYSACIPLVVVQLIAEIDALRAEIKRLHEKYDLQLLVVQRDRYREALKIIATQDISQHQMMHVAELALKACNAPREDRS